MREVKYKSGYIVRVYLLEKQVKFILLNVKIVFSFESGNNRGFGGVGDGVFFDLGFDYLGVVICGNLLWKYIFDRCIFFYVFYDSIKQYFLNRIGSVFICLFFNVMG